MTDLGTVYLVVWVLWSFQPDKTEQLSLSLSQKLVGHQKKSYQPDEKGEGTMNTLKTTKSLLSFTTVPKQ